MVYSDDPERTSEPSSSAVAAASVPDTLSIVEDLLLNCFAIAASISASLAFKSETSFARADSFFFDSAACSFKANSCAFKSDVTVSSFDFVSVCSEDDCASSSMWDLYGDHTLVHFLLRKFTDDQWPQRERLGVHERGVRSIHFACQTWRSHRPIASSRF